MFKRTKHCVYPLKSPAHEVRKVGFVSSDSRENP